MPRYYFHLLNDIEVQNEEGKELPAALTAGVFVMGAVMILLLVL